MSSPNPLTASLTIDHAGQLAFSISNSETATTSEMNLLYANLGTLEAAINHAEDSIEGGATGPDGNGCAYAVVGAEGLISSGAYGVFSSEVDWDLKLEQLDDEFYRVRLNFLDNQPKLPIIALTHGVPNYVSDSDREALIDCHLAAGNLQAMAAECARRSPQQVEMMEQLRDLEIMKNEH
jgi:hypothetical protein